MKTILLASIALIAIGSAHAETVIPCQQGVNCALLVKLFPHAIIDSSNDPVTIVPIRTRPLARANANADAMGGSATASGGNASATASAAPVAGANGGSVSVTNAVSGGGASREAAATAYAPSVGGGGFDCPTVGFGAGGTGLGGSGSFGPSWISSRCDHRRYAELIAQLTHDPAAGLAYLASVESDVADFLKQREPSPTATTVPTPPAPPGKLPLTALNDGHQTDLCKPEAGWTAAEIATLREKPECK